MSIRHELASLLAGFDVETLRRERDEAIDLLALVDVSDIDDGFQWISVSCSVARFINTLPIGAVDAARARLHTKKDQP